MNAATHFAQSYAEARGKFLAAGEARGARRSRHVHPSERGAEGEELSIDLAQIGDDRAPGLLLLTSGTHGVEGFCGSCSVGARVCGGSGSASGWKVSTPRLAPAQSRSFGPVRSA